MALKINTFLLVLLLILVPLSLGLAEGFRENMHPTTHHGLLYKGDIKVNSRKLFSHNFVLDYDEAGPNPRHTKKPGKGP
ncbi:hypothetical protein Fmac_007534 [Flemingia macrophylla]|uniref:Transmembrane protein n=1 Tax=Flemingia macrophylla TaxID=520843 RepID=A0ABD1MUX0_9FABA